MSAPHQDAAPPGREFDIDSFRGFVCISLVLLHYYNSSLYDFWRRIGGETLNYIILHMRFGVESFFILAGFMMAHMLRPAPGESVSLGLYLKRRFYRLIIPYWIAVALATADRWLVYLMFKRGGGHLPGALDVFAQLTLLQEYFRVGEAAFGLWSMVTLEQFYLLWLAVYAVVCLAFRSGDGSSAYGRAERVMAWLTFGAAALSAAALLVGYDYRWNLPLWLIHLATGMLLYWAVRQRFQIVLFVAVVALLAVVAVETRESRPIKSLLVVAMLTPLARGYRLPKYAVLRGLAWVGQRSYSVYLVHGIVGLRIFSFASKLGKADWVPFVLLAVALAGSLLAATLFYKYIELPCRMKARRVQFRRSPAPPPLAVSSPSI